MKSTPTKLDKLFVALTLNEGREWEPLGRSLRKLGQELVETFATVALAEMGVLPSGKRHGPKRYRHGHRHHPSHHYRGKGLSSGLV